MSIPTIGALGLVIALTPQDYLKYVGQTQRVCGLVVTATGYERDENSCAVDGGIDARVRCLRFARN